MKIVLDCYGADYSPDELVKGAITSVNLIDDVEIILTGNQEEIQKVIDEVGYKGNKLEIVDAKDVIDCNESPTMAIRRKTDSSLVKGLNILKPFIKSWIVRVKTRFSSIQFSSVQFLELKQWLRVLATP